MKEQVLGKELLPKGIKRWVLYLLNSVILIAMNFFVPLLSFGEQVDVSIGGLKVYQSTLHHQLTLFNYLLKNSSKYGWGPIFRLVFLPIFISLVGIFVACSHHEIWRQRLEWILARLNTLWISAFMLTEGSFIGKFLWPLFSNLFKPSPVPVEDPYLFFGKKTTAPYFYYEWGFYLFCLYWGAHLIVANWPFINGGFRWVYRRVKRAVSEL